MSRLLSVSRAARLVGTTRGALQKRIRNGEIASFEGQVKLTDLGELYPDVAMEDTTMLERVEQIIERAFHQVRSGQSAAPDMQTLASRVTELSNELANAKFEVSNYSILIDKLKSKLRALQQDSSVEVATAATQLTEWLAYELSNQPTLEPVQEELIASDNLLRIVAAQVHVVPSGHEFLVQGSDSVLDAALSAGLAMDYGCSNGNCGKCKARLVSGELRKTRNHDYVLTEAEKLHGYFLCCSNSAVTDVVVEANEAHNENEIPLQRITAQVRKVDFPHDDVAVLSLKTPRTQRLRFMAGQSVDLTINGLPAHSLPIASCPCDDRNLQFHIPRKNGDEFSDYIFELKNASSGAVTIEGPSGHFVLHEEDLQRPLIFVAYDTGFAPIKSLIEHALNLETSELVHLYWVAPKSRGHYLGNMCRAWADAFDSFRYSAILANDSKEMEFGHETVDTLYDTLIAEHNDLSVCDVFVSGPDRPVTQFESILQQSGLNASQIFRQIA